MSVEENPHRHASFLIGVVPPSGLTVRVQELQTRLGLRESAPHVTVKARSGLGPDLSWKVAARAVVAASPPLALRVGGARIFPNGGAVYLDVTSPDVIALHLRLLEALGPTGRFGYEGPQMTPHLTLALRRRGVDPGAVLEAAHTEFADLEARSFAFTASEVWVLRKPGPGGLYVPEEAWPLVRG